MYYYAQINDDNIVTGVSHLSGEVSRDNLISIPSYDTSLIGKTWDGVSFQDAPDGDSA
jgi:hypothetical protein